MFVVQDSIKRQGYKTTIVRGSCPLEPSRDQRELGAGAAARGGGILKFRVSKYLEDRDMFLQLIFELNIFLFLNSK